MINDKGMINFFKKLILTDENLRLNFRVDFDLKLI